MKTSNVIAGVLVGVIAGAAIGILCAPDKGSETRKRLSDKGRDLAGTLKDSLGDWVDKAVSKYDDVRENFSGAAQDIKSKASNMRTENNV